MTRTITLEDMELETESPEVQALREGIYMLDTALEMATGSGPFERKLCAYYTAATYQLNKFKKFGLLALHGYHGVGKSQTLFIIKNCCYKPVEINCQDITQPVFRELLRKAEDGTALVEELDEAPEWVESYLLGRYQTETATAGKMVPVGSRGWTPDVGSTYGATVIHRRDPFESAALESRCIWVGLTPNVKRASTSYVTPADSVLDSIKHKFSITASVELTAPGAIAGNVSARVRDTYMPILLVARAADDIEFIVELVTNHMPLLDTAFKDGQAFSPPAIVVKALIQVLADHGGGKLDFSRSVKVEAEILRKTRYDYQQTFSPKRACSLLRQAGFPIRQSAGVSVVDVTLPSLAKACLNLGIEDELVQAAIAGGP